VISEVKKSLMAAKSKEAPFHGRSVWRRGVRGTVVEASSCPQIMYFLLLIAL